jgi:hypothetical protein
MLSKAYDALIAAGTPDEKARAATEELRIVLRRSTIAWPVSKGSSQF